MEVMGVVINGGGNQMGGTHGDGNHEIENHGGSLKGGVDNHKGGNHVTPCQSWGSEYNHGG